MLSTESRGPAGGTGIGRFLRQSRLDELPQRWNARCGELGELGELGEPRGGGAGAPLLPRRGAARSLSTQYSALVGGWAQVHDGYGSSVPDALMTLQYDLFSVKHQSQWLDLAIAWRTVGVVLRFRGT